MKSKPSKCKSNQQGAKRGIFTLPERESLHRGPEKSEGFFVDRPSDREREVFRFIGEGASARHIAEKRSISIKTVETYIAHVKSKSGIASGTELQRLAFDWTHKEGRGDFQAGP